MVIIKLKLTQVRKKGIGLIPNDNGEMVDSINLFRAFYSDKNKSFKLILDLTSDDKKSIPKEWILDSRKTPKTIKKVKEPTSALLEGVLMPNGEFIHNGKGIWMTKRDKVYKKEWR